MMGLSKRDEKDGDASGLEIAEDATGPAREQHPTLPGACRGD